MKQEHSNGRSMTPGDFESRMITKREREARDEAEKNQSKVPVHVVEINGVKVSHGELPQVAHQIGAKRALKLVAYFTSEGQETSENWRQIYRQIANCSANPDCAFFLFHIPIGPGMDSKMNGTMHKSEPDTVSLMCSVVTAITDGESGLIPVIQGSKHWALPGRGMVELTLTWL